MEYSTKTDVLHKGKTFTNIHISKSIIRALMMRGTMVYKILPQTTRTQHVPAKQKMLLNGWVDINNYIRYQYEGFISCSLLNII